MLWVSLLCLLACVLQLAQAAWSFKMVASTNTQVPGQPMRFGAFGSMGVTSDSGVFFLGYSGSSFVGVYKDTIPPSSVTVVTDSSHDIPPLHNLVNTSNLGSKFDFFQLGTSSSSTLSSLEVFVGGSYAIDSAGVFFPSLETVATTHTLIPHENVKIMSLHSPSLNDPHQQIVVFTASVLDLDTQEEDDYILLSSVSVSGRQLEALVNHHTVMPDSPNLKFTLLAGSIIVDDKVVFFGSNFIKSNNKESNCTGHLPEHDSCINNGTANGPWPGLYMMTLSQPEVLSVLVDMTSVVPDGEGAKYNAFSDPCFDGRSIAYVAAFGSSRGIFVYSLIQKSAYMVVSFASVVPGTKIPYSAFPHIPSIKGDVVIFYGATASPNQKYGGIFRSELRANMKLKNGTSQKPAEVAISKVINKQDLFDGSTVYLLGSSRDAFNGNNVAFFCSLMKSGKQTEAVIVGIYS